MDPSMKVTELSPIPPSDGWFFPSQYHFLKVKSRKVWYSLAVRLITLNHLPPVVIIFFCNEPPHHPEEGRRIRRDKPLLPPFSIFPSHTQEASKILLRLDSYPPFN